MRCIHLLTVAFFPAMLIAQAPSWQWARSFPLSGFGGAVSSLAQDSGYFLSLAEQELQMPWGFVESTTGLLIHMNALGEPTTAVAMPPITRLLPNGENDARFMITYRDSCVLPDGTLLSPAGIGVAMGVVDREGSLSDVVNMPDLVVGADCAITDLDLAPNGDLLVVGWFRDTVHCADSTFFADGYFLCRFTSGAQLLSAMSIPNPTLGWLPTVRVESDGAEGAYVAMQEFATPVPDSTYGAGTVIASFDTDWGLRWSRSSTDQIGLYSDGPIYLAKAPEGGIYAAYTSAPSAFWSGRVTALAYNSDGTERWLNTTFGPQFEFGASGVMGIASSPTFHGPLVSIYTYGQMENYGPYPITNNGTPNAVVAALDSIGQWKWAISDNGPGNLFGTQAVVSSNGTIYASGHFEGNGALGPFPLTYTSPVSLFAGRIGLGIGPVGFETNTTRNDMVIYPNPAQDLLHLSRPLPQNMLVVDLLGRDHTATVLRKDANTLDVSRLPPGAYVIQLGMARTVFIKT